VKEVEVFRFITKKSYEEVMFEKASKKLGMEHAVFSKGAFHQTDESIEKKDKPSTEDIENLLKFGAYAFIEGSDDEDQGVMEIDEILKKTKKETESKPFSKSTFEIDEKVPKVSDAEFWQKMLPALETVSIVSMEKKMRAGKSEIITDEESMKEYLKQLDALVTQVIDTKKSANDVFSTEDDETRLRGLIMKFQRIQKIPAGIRDESKQLMRTLNTSVEEITLYKQYDSKKKDQEEVVDENPEP
jgi:SNF2 family DNA or RNA helicase